MRTQMLATLVLLFAGSAPAATLRTETFQIEIKLQCSSPAELCLDVHYAGTHIRTGDTVALTGRVIPGSCKLSVAGCLPWGYQFRAGLLTYTVLVSGDLMITEDRKVLVMERGQWQ